MHDLTESAMNIMSGFQDPIGINLILTDAGPSCRGLVAILPAVQDSVERAVLVLLLVWLNRSEGSLLIRNLLCIENYWPYLILDQNGTGNRTNE